MQPEETEIDRLASSQRTLRLIGVVLLLAGLSTAAFLTYARPRGNAGGVCRGVARTICTVLRQATLSYLVERPNADCPTVRELKDAGALDPSLDPADPWGEPYKIVCSEDTITVSSSGPDRLRGTDNDIVVP